MPAVSWSQRKESPGERTFSAISNLRCLNFMRRFF
jgi:hypothetical protein